MSHLKRIISVITVFLLLAVAVPARAQQQSASGLSISPTRVELSMQPGQAEQVQISLKNVTNEDVVARPFVNDFESDNETGNPRIILDTSKKSSSSIRDYVAGLEDVPLAVGEQKNITVFIQLPSSIPPGGYFGAIRYLAIPKGTAEQQNGEVALSASVSTLVLIEVPGNIREQVQLKNLHIYDGDKAGVFFTTPPSDIGVEIKNLGNSFVKPFGKVTVNNMQGKEVYSYEINNVTPRSNVLPDSIRIFKDEVKNIKTPGRYTVMASISYGKGSEVLVYKKAFWYIPLWMLVIILAVLALLAFGIWYAYRRYRGSGGVKTSKRKRSRR